MSHVLLSRLHRSARREEPQQHSSKGPSSVVFSFLHGVITLCIIITIAHHLYWLALLWVGEMWKRCTIIMKSNLKVIIPSLCLVKEGINKKYYCRYGSWLRFRNVLVLILFLLLCNFCQHSSAGGANNRPFTNWSSSARQQQRQETTAQSPGRLTLGGWLINWWSPSICAVDVQWADRVANFIINRQECRSHVTRSDAWLSGVRLTVNQRGPSISDWVTERPKERRCV